MEPDDEVMRAHVHLLASIDLLASRPCLPFLPGVPLPQPDDGRSLAFLLNRLSNNVVEPGLLGRDGPIAASAMLTMLRYGLDASAALATVETGGAVIQLSPLTRPVRPDS